MRMELLRNRAERLGFEAGRMGLSPRKCPYGENSRARKIWLAAWEKGQQTPIHRYEGGDLYA